jgi:hypothetical protein
MYSTRAGIVWFERFLHGHGPTCKTGGRTTQALQPSRKGRACLNRTATLLVLQRITPSGSCKQRRCMELPWVMPVDTRRGPGRLVLLADMTASHSARTFPVQTHSRWNEAGGQGV